MLGTHKPRINCIFCWSILTSLPILTSICVRLQWKCHLMVNHVTSDSIGQRHYPHGSNTRLTVLCYALHWIVKYSQMGVSLILRSLHKNVTKIAACYMWQFFRWLTIMLRAGSVEAKKPDYSSFKAIWRISNTWILILFNLSLEHLPASRIQFSKILYTGKFLSKQCWDIIFAPIQSRLDLSSNKEYVVQFLRKYT